jgi:hypothetical protein
MPARPYRPGRTARTVCRVMGHAWVFRTITIPRERVCRRCGKVGA